MLDQVLAALTAIKAEGTFAIQQTCGSEDLHIEVKGVGPIAFPISAATARKLCAMASPAPFGHRDKTLHDPSVRDTWQLGPRQVKIDTQRWKRSLDDQLSIIGRRLGWPDKGKLEAVFDKLLVYEPGQFFAPHQDSERTDDMFGSLVVELPSTYSGGATVVQHHAEKKIFRSSKRGPKNLSLLAFYADCHHEVRPIKSGYRLALTYQLRHHGATNTKVPAVLSAAVDRLAESVQAYFSTPVTASYSRSAPQQPDRLIYLLDHEYTQKSLAWGRLKNGDRLRAAALQKVSERLDCEIYLTLADVHESWSCESDDWDDGYGSRREYRSRRQRSSWDEEADTTGSGSNEDSTDYKMVELCDWDIELRNWVDPSGQSAPDLAASLAQNEVCYTKASVDMKPFESEHEGWMGNYGNTVDRWYHRAAVVMWPQTRNFVIRAKISPAWAISELAAQFAVGGAPAAHDKARSLLPFWERASSLQPSAPLFRELLTVLGSLDDAELAHAMLAPFGPHWLSPEALPAFITLVARHGLAWSKRVLSTWSQREHYQAPPWLKLLPGLCLALLATPAEHGRELAEWLLEREVGAFQIRHIAALRVTKAWLWEDKAEYQHNDLLALLDGAAVLRARSVRDGLVAFLMAPATALPLMSAGALLKECREGRTSAAVRALGLQELYRQVVNELEQTLAAPERGFSDWSIAISLPCKCELCAVLAAFLGARDRIEYAWPLAKDKRQHIHQIMDAHSLPVIHTTIRQGSPYTLVLTKQKALFERVAALRERKKALLIGLKKQRSAFSTDSEVSDFPG